MSDVSLGTLYELNQELMKSEKKMTEEELNEALKKIKSFFQSKGTYFMLLCHEQRDYTIFRKNGYVNMIVSAEQELKTCLLNRGQIISIDELHDGNFEIWILNDITNEPCCYFLFPYDEGVIEYC